MEHLYTPWRSSYVTKENPNQRGKAKKKACFFCQHQKSLKDEKNLVIARFSNSFVLLNLYPYNDGHLLVAPYRHVGHPRLLSALEWQELHESSRKAIQVLETVLHAEGFNVGMNLGRVSGAGIEDHLHLHVVPRWLGDTNFMPILAKTKTINQNLAKLYKRLKSAF